MDESKPSTVELVKRAIRLAADRTRSAKRPIRVAPARSC